MELKAWDYESFPAFDEEAPGAVWLDTTGREPGADYFQDVEYCEIDGVKLRLQILVPQCRETRKYAGPEQALDSGRPAYPCVVYVQGSGWMKQNVYHNLPQIAKLAARGFVVAVAEYRHCGIAPFPAPVVDARNAARFMRKNARRWCADPEKMIIAGDSSGGHTAVYAGIYHNDGDPAEDLFPGVSGEVKGIINLYGSTDFLFDDSNPSTPNHNLPDSPEGLEMGGINLREDTAAAERLTVRANIFPRTRIAPVLNLHGTKDRTVNCRCSVNLYERLKACGKDTELYLLRGADHGGNEFWTDETLDIMERFIRRCVK